MERVFQFRGQEHPLQSWIPMFLTDHSHLVEMMLGLPLANLCQPSSQQQDHEEPVLRTLDYCYLWQLKMQIKAKDHSKAQIHDHHRYDEGVTKQSTL